MICFTSCLITAFLAYTTLASPIIPDVKTNTTEEQLVVLYGPISTWKEIKLIDAFPGALVDGKPADSSVVFARIPSAIANRTPNVAPRDELSAQGTCYNGDSLLLWTSQYQLRSVKGIFCTEAQDHHIDNGGQYGALLYKYRSASGTFADFTDSYGNVTPYVWYWIQINNGFVFNFEYCLSAMETVILCRGGISDSRGGESYSFNGGQTNSVVKPST